PGEPGTDPAAPPAPCGARPAPRKPCRPGEAFFSFVHPETPLMTRDPSPARRPRTRARRPNFRPRLEALEQPCLLSAGALDPAFGQAGKVLTDFSTSSWDHGEGAAAVALQADGKILVAGGYENVAGNSGDLALLRYNSDGTLDGTFGSGGLETRYSGYG